MKNINLTKDQWAVVLAEGQTPKKLAHEIRRGHFSPWVGALQDCIKNSGTLLSLGEGRGDVTAVLALQGIRPTLLDWSPRNISFSKKLFKILNIQGDFYCRNMQKPLPFKDNSFDTVLLCSILQYFDKAEIRGILQECFRVAKKRVIAISPNALCAVYRVGKWHMEKRKKWPWGDEKPFFPFRSFFRSVSKGPFREFSVAGLHSLEFLTMRGGAQLRNWLRRIFRLKQHSASVPFRQGYMLFAVGEKSGEAHA